MQARVRALVRGHVQGVYFRDFARTQARMLDLAGYVRNLPDGRTVEVMAEGPRGTLERFLAQLGKGPSSAKVEEVDVEWGEFTGEFSSFEVRYP